MKFARIISVWGLFLVATCALANPDGAQVVHGSASFSKPNANTLNVTNSRNAIINWQSFNIGKGQTTNFHQPGSNSAVLNRVLGNNPSSIYGNLNSNGKVFLINQHGLMIGAGARINTAGFYGSTLNITNEDFLKGNLKFEGGGFGGINNQGYIHAGPNGNVVLIAPDIENGGVIEVDNGNVILAAGESIRITSLNDADIEFDVQSPDNGIINLGDIIAKQGAARLFAGNLKHSGSINATGLVRNADGSISLVAQQDIEVTAGATLNADGDTGGNITVQSHHGDVYFEGTASARGETHHGGNIRILGDRVGLFGDATVDASGKTGGGEVLIGGAFQGKGEIQTARQTQVGPHASIRADALESGDGGKVIVWADDFTLFEGEATARGGDSSGDGGFIEISGKDNLGYYGTVDASASNGTAGSVLFDPVTVTFTLTGGPSLPVNPYTFTDDPGQVLAFAPNAITDLAEAGTQVIVQADRDIIFDTDIIVAAGGNGGDMTFQAGQSITINADIFTDNGTLQLFANSAFDPVVTPTTPDPGNRGTGTAELKMLPGTTIDTGTGNVEFWMNSGVNGTAGNIDLANVNANHVLIKHNGLDPGGSILQSGGGTITALSVFIDHDGPTDGFVGSPDPALNLVADNVGAHIHAPTFGGIWIDATPNSSTDVTVGNTCYGNGDPGCDTFPPHTVKGIETINGAGRIEFNVNGNLIVDEPISVTDNLGSGNAGPITVNVFGDLTSNAPIFNEVDVINLSATGDLNFNADVTAAAPLTDINLDADSDFVGGGQINLNSKLDANTGIISAPDDTVEINLAAGTVNSDMSIQTLNLVEGTLDGIGNISVSGLTTWNPATSNSLAQDFFLLGSGFLFANGGFDLGFNLDNDTLNLDKFLVIGAVFSIWNDAGFAGNTITGTGGIINNGLIQAFNVAQLDINVPLTNNVQITKESGAGVLLFTNGLIMATGSRLDIFPGTVVNPGAPLVLSGAAELSGGGTLDGSVNSFGGIIDIEDGTGLPATLTITGSLFLDLTSTLAFDLGGPGQGVEYDFLDVGGNVTLDGTLALFWDRNFTAGYTAFDGANFDLIQAGTGISGVFDTIIDPAGVTDSSSSGIVSIPPDVFRYFTDTVSPNVIFWNVNASGNWDNLANWFWPGGADRVPLATDYVVINQDDGALVVTIQDARTIAGMQSQNNITISSTGSLTMNDDLLFTGDSLVLDSAGAGLTMNGIATVAGELEWNSGSIAGSGSIDIYYLGTLSINPGAGNLDNAIFNNTLFGSTWSGGAAAGSGILTNNGLLDFNGAGNFSSAITLVNSALGSITKVDANTTTLTGTVTAGGNFQVDAGTLELQNPVAINADFSIASGATLSFTGGGNYTSVGSIGGSGIVDVTGASSFTSSGFIEPGGAFATGILTFNGDLNNTGFIQIDIESNGGGSPTPGVDYDRLVVTGNADLQGFISLFAVGSPQYTVTNGDTFVPVVFASSTSNSLGFLPIGGEAITPTYGPVSLTLQLNAPNLITWSGGGDGISWNDPANWDLGLPSFTDDVSIPGVNVTITGGDTARTITLAFGGLLTLNSGSFVLATDSSIQGDLTLNGGTFASGGTLTLDGSILTLAGGVFQGTNLNNSLGIISGSGTINVSGGTLFNDGDILPGGASATGIITVQGNLALGSTSNLEFEINDTGTQAGTDYDQIIVDGPSVVANLDGLANQTQLAGPPAAGTYRFIDVINGGTLTGTFGLENVIVGFNPSVYGATFYEATFVSGAVFWDGDDDLDGGDGVNWLDPLNWSGDAVPLISDDVTIGGTELNITIAGAANANTLSLASGYTLNLTSGSLAIATSAQIDGNLTITGGTVDITGANLLVNGGMIWNGNSTIQGGGSGVLDIAAGAILSIPGTSSRNLTELTLTINPTARLEHGNAGGLSLNTGTIVDNAGTIEFQADVDIFSSGGATINNTGTIEKTAGAGNSAISVVTNHTGATITQAAGTITFTAGGSFAGANTVTGGPLNLNGGVTTFIDGVTLAADLNVTAGTLDIEGGLTVGQLNFSAGTINIDTLAGGSVGDTLTATSGINWTGNSTFTGGGSGILDIPNGTILSISGTSNRNLTSLTAVINPTARLEHSNAGGLSLNSGTILDNAGTIEFIGSVNVFSSGGATINNSGTIEKTAGPGDSAISIFTNHTGATITQTAGTITFTSGGSFDGANTVTGGPLNISGGVTTFVDGVTLAVDLNVTGGTLDIEGGLTVGQLTFSFGQINIDTLAGGSVGDTLSATSGIVWDNNSTFFGGGTGILDIPNGTILSISGTSNRNLTSLTAVINPTARLEHSNAGGLSLNSGTILDNAGTIEFIGSVNVFSSGGATINNSGTIEKTAGPGDSAISIFTNHTGATITQTAGTITFTSGGSFDGANTVTGGPLNISGGVTTFVDGVTLAADLNVTGGTLDIEGGLTVGQLTFSFGQINIDTLAGGSVGDTLSATSGIVWDNNSTFFGGGTGILDIPNGTILSISGTSNRNLTSLTAVINPTARLEHSNAGGLSLNSGTILDNAGTIEFIGSVNVFSSGGATINNSGTIEKTAGPGDSAISIFTNHTGATITQTAGTITFTSGGSFDGANTVTGGPLNISGGVTTFVDGVTLAADLNVTGGTLDIEGGLTVGQLTFSFGQINIDTLAGGSVGDTLSATSGIVWDNNSTFFGGGTGILDIPNGTLLDVTGPSNRNLTSLTLDINPSATLVMNNANGLSLNSGTIVNNQGTIDIQADVGMATSGGATINNGGTIEKTGGTGLSNIQVNTIQTAATIDIQTGTLAIINDLTLDSGSVLQGSGTFQGDVTNDGGTVHPGGADTIGILSIDGNYTNTSGTVIIEIDNDVAAAGTSYDLIAVTGSADLNDTLTLLVIGGYIAFNNDVLSPITYNTDLGGTFTTINPTGIETVAADYAPPSLDLTLTVAGGITWNGAINNDWFNNGNWLGGTAPATGDAALIPNGSFYIVDIAGAAVTGTLALGSDATLTLSSGSLTLENNSSLDGSLVVAGGTLNVNNQVTINGSLNWTSVTPSIINGGGTGSLVINGALNVSGDNLHTFNAMPSIDNQGTTTYVATSGSINFNLNNGTTFDNNGVFEFQEDLTLNSTSGVAAFNSNSGSEIRKSGGSGIATFGNTVNVTATDTDFNATSGNIALGTVSSIGGNVNVLANNLVFAGGNIAVANGTVINGNVDYDTGTLNLAGTLLINDVLNWNSQIGTLINGGGVGDITIASTAVLNINGDNLHTLNNVSVTNNGITNYAASPGASAWQLNNGTTFDNNNLIDIQDDLNISTSSGVGTLNNNSGFEIRKSAGAGTAGFDGTLVLNNDDATLNAVSGNFSISASAVFSGNSTLVGGNLDLVSNTITFANGSIVDGNLDYDTGVVSIPGTATFNGTFNWNSAVNTAFGGGGTLIVSASGTLNILGDNLHTLNNFTIDNQGITNYQATAGGTAFFINNGSVFDNSGLFDIQEDLTIGNSSGAGQFNNAGGEIRKSAGAGAAIFAPVITVGNTAGTVNIESGSLTMNGGSLILDTGSLLTGSGAFNGDVTNNGGILNPGAVGSTGVLTINGDFTNNAGGAVQIDVMDDGVLAGSSWDQLDVQGQADLDGTLVLLGVDGHTPANNATLTPIVYSSKTPAEFASYIDINGENITPTYTGNLVTPGDLSLLLSFSGLFNFVGVAGGGDGTTWNDANNWDLGVPGIGNDARIGAGFSVTIAAAANANTLSLTSASTLDINSGGVLTIASSVSLDGLLTINAGQLDISGAVATVDAGLNWAGTSVITGGTLNLNSAFNISAGATNILDGVTANITGVTTYSGGNLTLANGSSINVIDTFDFAADVGIVDGGGAASIFNTGNGSTVIKSAGALTSAIDSTLLSTINGSVVVQTGTLNLNLTTLTLDVGDVFAGSGTYIGNVVNNGGIVRPGGAGAVGTLTVNGDYTNAAGTLEVEIDSAVTHDVLAVNNFVDNGNAASSILDISIISFIPSVTETHNVITCVTACTTLTQFGTVNQPAGVTHSVNYNATNLNLTVTSVSFFWDGGGALDNWFDPLNWSLDVLPNVGTDVVLASGNNVTFDGGLATVASLTLNGGSSLNLASGTLTNAGILAVSGGASLAITGGNLLNTGAASFAGNYSHTSGNATFSGNTVFNGNYSQGGGAETFAGTVAFNGSNTHGGGTTTFNGISSFAGATQVSGGTLTFNAVGTMLNLNNTWSGGTITGAAGPNLVLGVVPGDTTLAVVGAGTKTLDTITLDMNRNDINMSGSGNLNLVNGAIIDNTGGTSFNHSGNGGLTGTGTFNNTAGHFNKLSGGTVIAPTVNFINTGTSLVNVSGGALTFTAAGADAGNYNVGSAGTLAFTNGKSLAAGSSLNLAGNLVVGNGVSPTTLRLPGTLNNTGNIQLNNATLDLSNLGGSTLPLTGGARLGGTGTVAGNVANASGVIVVGGAGNLGNLAITGSYNQGASSAIVVEAFNNGFTTVSDRLMIGGPSTLNGGTLVIGFTTNSLGLVTANFSPISAPAGVTGGFSRVIDAAGRILFIDFSGGEFTILGASPKIPDKIIDDLISFLQNSDELAREIASNRSQAEAIIEQLLEEEALEQDGLVCN